MRRGIVTILVWALAACGCDGDNGAGAGGDPPPMPDVGVSSDQGVELEPLQLTLTSALPTGHPDVSLRVLVEGLDNPLRRVHLLPPIEAWPAEVELDGVAPGEYRVVAFHDRGGDDVFDGCPFPHEPGHTTGADAFDNVHGVYEGPVDEAAIEVRVERHICGPGDLATGLRGRVVPPEGAHLEGVAIHLLLTPLSRRMATDEPEPMRSPLQVPLLPQGLTDAVDFELGQLVPGDYALTLFADEDGDGKPTPCGPGIGGGDRHLATVMRFEVVAGERRPLEADLRLETPEGCPDTLTGVRGELRLDNVLVAAMADDPSLTEPLGVLAGPVRLALFDAADATVATMELLPGLDAKARAFTVSGLPPGEWRIALWLDRDDDGQFGPCGGLPAGLDTVYVQSDVEIRDGALSDLDELVLAEGECEPGLITGLRGRVRAPTEGGSVGSGRPVRLELYPVADGAERRSVLLFENHGALPDEPASFVAVDVPPGEYRGRVYVDTDRDGDFTSCADAPFADRATTEVFTVQVGVDGLTDVGALDPVLLGCEVPDAAVTPRILGDALAELDAVGPLRLWIEEAGGWHQDRQLDRRFDAQSAAMAPPRISLAPGDYRLVAYLDLDDDARYGACGDEHGTGADVFSAAVEIILDEQAPEATPELQLDDACR